MANYEMLSDQELIENLRKGDSKIMDYLMDKYKGMVRKKAKAMYLLGGENDDLIQEGMIGLFKAVQDYNLERGSSFFTFADLCVSRQMYTAIEASQRKKHMPLNSYVSIYSEGGHLEQLEQMQNTKEMYGNPESVMLSQEYQEGFEKKLQEELSELENKVLYLHMIGEDYRSIAKLLDKRPKTIDNALQRIKSKAKSILDRN